MRRDLLVAVLHGVIVWIMLRMLASTAIASGAQDVLALTAATAVTVAFGTLVTAWIGRSLDAPSVALVRRFMIVPALLATWSAVLVARRGATPAEIALAPAAYLAGAVVVILLLSWRARRPRSTAEPGMTGSFG